MKAKARVLDRMIKRGYSTEGHAYFWYLNNFTLDELLKMERKIEKKG